MSSATELLLHFLQNPDINLGKDIGQGLLNPGSEVSRLLASVTEEGSRQTFAAYNAPPLSEREQVALARLASFSIALRASADFQERPLSPKDLRDARTRAALGAGLFEDQAPEDYGLSTLNFVSAVTNLLQDKPEKAILHVALGQVDPRHVPTQSPGPSPVLAVSTRQPAAIAAYQPAILAHVTPSREDLKAVVAQGHRFIQEQEAAAHHGLAALVTGAIASFRQALGTRHTRVHAEGTAAQISLALPEESGLDLSGQLRQLQVNIEEYAPAKPGEMALTLNPAPAPTFTFRQFMAVSETETGFHQGDVTPHSAHAEGVGPGTSAASYTEIEMRGAGFGGGSLVIKVG